MATDLSHCPNYWVPRDVIESGSGATTAEAAVCSLHDHIVGPTLPHDWAGAEYWVQVYEGGRGLAFHFDKDEHAMKEEGRMVTPILSSVLYLTGHDGEINSDSDSDNPAEALQAPTVVTDQRYDYEEGCAVPDNPTSSTLVFPGSNSYCLFDGSLGHGVLDCGRQEERATLLVNWWKRKPENVNRVPFLEKEESDIEERKGGNRDDDEHVLPSCVYPETVEVEERELGKESMLMVGRKYIHNHYSLNLFEWSFFLCPSRLMIF